MWSRIIELMLGCWLVISPFIFRHDSQAAGLWANDLAVGTVVVVFSVLSYWRPTRHAHFLTMGAGAWLCVFAYIQGFGDPSPASQNHLIMGILLLMFGLIPNHAPQPPEAWQVIPPSNLE